MEKVILKEMLDQLSDEQQHSLYEAFIQRRAGHEEQKKTKLSKPCDIAIIGLNGRYPQSDNHYDFWRKIQEGKSLIGEVPVERWNHDEFYDQRAKKSFIPSKTCCKFGAFLKTHNEFDASFFEINDDEVYYMDPQERLALETTWSCIEDAGYVPAQLGTDVGIFSGLTYSEYQKLVPISTHSFFLNSRIAYFFNFQGPTITTDAGCVSSLRAIDLACQSLIKEDCKTAIVIGANIILHPDHYATASTMLSTTTEPYSSPFGKDDGWIPAEGVISVLLKPLKQAVQDRNHIYAVIKSSLVKQAGKTSWFTAPDPKKQAKLIQDNFEKCGINPETISYVEAAANGSPFGDAIELDALTMAFKQFTNKKQFCPVGSVKSYVGHGEGVSTLLQLTTMLLQFKSKTVIPLIELDEINPNIQIEHSPFYFQTSTKKWEPPVIELNSKQYAMPRRATISSFSASGDIGHLILEEYVEDNSKKSTLENYFIPVSSKTTNQLEETINNYIAFFEEYQVFDSERESNYTPLNVMFTLCTGRIAFQERVVFIVNNIETLVQYFYLFINKESNPSIIAKENVVGENYNAEDTQKLVYGYLKSQSWHDLAKLWVQGVDIYWDKFFNGYNARRVPLPTYSFQRQPFPVPEPVYL